MRTAIAAITPLVSVGPAPGEWQMCGLGKRVTCVHDGDTVWRQDMKIRLMSFDTLEMGMLARCKRERRLVEKATARLKELLSGGHATIESKDQYQRALAIDRAGSR